MRRKEEEEEVVKHEMVSTISFTQAILQHNIAASRVFTRTVIVKGKDMALKQEPWYHKGCIMSLNISGYNVLHKWDRPRACILARNMNIWMLL